MATPPLPSLDDQPERPSTTRRPTSSIYLGDDKPKTGTVGLGFAGRVGLGSPRLEFFQRRDGGASGSGEADDGSSKAARRGSYIDDRSGLPSPPRTESEVGTGQPLPALPSVDDDIPSAASKPRLRPRTPSLASTTNTMSLQRSSSSSTSSRRLQPKVPAGMTRSTSSSSSIYSLSLRNVTLPGSGESSGMSDKSRTPSPVKRPSPSISALRRVSKTPSLPDPDNLSRHSSRHSLGTVPLKEPSESGSSKRKASGSGSRAGKEAGESPLSRHSSRLSLGSYSSADVEAEAEAVRSTGAARRESANLSSMGGRQTEERPGSDERSVRRSPRRSAAQSPASEGEASSKASRRVSAGAELDERIREAEERIKRVNLRSARPQTASSTRLEEPSPPKATIRHRESVSRRTPAPESEKDKSGGSSGSGRRKPLPAEFRSTEPFTPSPKHPTHPIPTTGSSRSTRIIQLADSPEEERSPLANFTSPSSRRVESIDSPSSRFLRHEGIEGLDRSPSSASRDRGNYSRRQWTESLSGLPNDHPSPKATRSTISRSTSVLDNHVYDERRYQSRSSTLSSSSRLALTPGDSVSVVDRSPRESRKDPLDVLRRIEESREVHNRQWEEDRAGSVLGDFDSSPRRKGYDRPSSSDGRGRMTPQPQRPRPATSMSSVRDAYDRDAPPRSAPVHRLHRRAVEDAQLKSPLSSMRRSASRLSHGPPLTEPRVMRSSTSLGRQSSLDVHATRTEHGRLLLEAFRALELKLPPELLEAVPDLARALQATIVATENVNTSVRDSMAVANRTNVALDLGSPDRGQVRRDFDTLLPLLREAGRASDQSIRELTRVILDLPKLLREGGRLAAQESRGAGSQSPNIVRRSESLLSRSSFDSTRSPEVDQRRWTGGTSNAGSSPVSNYGAARERRSLDVMRPSSSMATFVSRFQRSPKKEALPPIDQSPPKDDGVPSAQREYGRSGSTPRTTPREFESSPRRSPAPPPRSPERFRNMLRKKASSTSTHTVRGSTTALGFGPLTPATTTTSYANGSGGGGGGGSAFFPSPIRRTTTAISQITAGDISPPCRVQSIRSERSASVEEMEVGSPVSRFSFQGRAGSEEADEDGDEGDAVKMLAAAAKRREGEQGTTGRWRSGWTRRTSKQSN